MYSPSDVKINQVRMEAFPDSERRQDRRFNRKGVVMNIQRGIYLYKIITKITRP